MDAMLPTNTQWRLLDMPSVSRYLAKVDSSHGHRQCWRMFAATQSITDVFLNGDMPSYLNAPTVSMHSQL
ncbi:hypothetical protein BDZ89DRAFT_1141780 [Hymenopellis radicata]|nr:hypothetical protein BDZ89DRAFT_1141780 [Hymenopellis radicata]